MSDSQQIYQVQRQVFDLPSLPQSQLALLANLVYEDSYIGFKFKVDKKEDDEEEGEGEKEKKKSKDLIVIPSSKNENKKMNDSHPSTDLEDLKNINSQLYDYSVFLSKK